MKRRMVVAPVAVGVMLAGTLTLVPGIAHASEAVGSGLGLGSATLAGPADEISATDLAVIEDELSQPRDGMIYSDDLSGESLDQDTDFSGTSPEQEGELELTTDGSEEGGDAFLGTPEGDDTTTKPGESADEAGLASGSPAGDAPEAGVDGSAEEAPSDDGDEVRLMMSTRGIGRCFRPQVMTGSPQRPTSGSPWPATSAESPLRSCLMTT